MKKILKKNNLGFTLVETLVAIAILMIAVAGPLVIASKGLRAALYSKDQMTASFLAQESMEYIKNIRDNSVYFGTKENWLDNLGPIQGKCINTSWCDADPISANPFANNYINTYNSSAISSPYTIYLNPKTGFTSASSPDAQPTIFKRYFYLVDVTPQDPNQKVVHVVVTWNEGSIPFEMDLSGLLTSQTR